MSNMAVRISIWGYVLDHQTWCWLIYSKRVDIWDWMLAALGLEPTCSPRWILLTEQLFMWPKKIKVSCYSGPHETHYHLILMTHILVFLHCFIPGAERRGGGITFPSTSVHHETLKRRRQWLQFRISHRWDKAATQKMLKFLFFLNFYPNILIFRHQDWGLFNDICIWLGPR